MGRMCITRSERATENMLFISFFILLHSQLIQVTYKIKYNHALFGINHYPYNDHDSV